MNYSLQHQLHTVHVGHVGVINRSVIDLHVLRKVTLSSTYLKASRKETDNVLDITLQIARHADHHTNSQCILVMDMSGFFSS